MKDSTSDKSNYQLALEQFVLYWGEMASAWGINKTMAQIHALLFASSEPLDTDTIMNELSISRGNANMNLHSLLDWKLISRINYPGDRKDYYQADKDVWATAAKIISERQRLEISPIRQNLRECLSILKPEKDSSEKELDFKNRIEDFLDLLELFEDFTHAILPYVSHKNLKSLRKLVNLALKRNLLRSKPEDILPIPPKNL
jgi:DNA-binding transcriptional regulator GbsR (MarR family)